MSHNYNPRRILRHVSNQLLQAFFANQKIEIAVDWKSIKETAIEPVFQAMQKLSDADHQKVEEVFQDIHALATEEGVRVLVQDGATWGKDLRAELDQWESRHDKAMWTFLNHEDVWTMALRLAHADSLSYSRNWITRVADIPKKKLMDDKKAKIDADVLGALETSLCAYYKEKEGRGHTCRVHHQLRKPSQHYFFVSLSDYTDTYDKLDAKKKEFVRELEQRAFQVVICYDESRGVLDVCAKGGKDVISALQDIFAQEVLDTSLSPDDGKRIPYNLNIALDPKFDFPVDPADGIDAVGIKRMRLAIKGSKRRIQFEGDPDKQVNDVHVMMSKYLNRSELPRAIIDVDLMSLKFSLRHHGSGKQPAFSFDISARSCSLKGKREAYRQLGEKCLKSWSIACA